MFDVGSLIAKVRVLQSTRLTASTHHVRFSRPKGFEFLPVQFVGLELSTAQGSEEYSMSLASPPSRAYLEFGARLSGSPWKQAFGSLRPGDEAEIDGPYGHFVLDESRPAVLLAGGIGITPLRGMAQYASDVRLDQDVRMVYSSRTQDDMPYGEQLQDLESSNPRFRLIQTLTREPAGSSWAGRRGRIDVALAQEAARGLENPIFYLCGLPGMVRDLANGLLRSGVRRDQLVYEAFWGYEPSA